MTTFRNMLSVLFSIAQGISTGMDVASSLLLGKNGAQNKLAASIAATIAGLIETGNAYYFNGSAIRGEHEPIRHEPNMSASYPMIDSEREPLLPIINSINPLTRESIGRSALSITTQSLYALMDLGKNFANRYFLLLVLFDLFSLDSTLPAFWIALAVDLLIKELFSLSNETYEAEEAIVKLIEKKHAPPFYRNCLFSPFSGPKACTFFKILCSIEHGIGDDVGPWIALLPREAIGYLKENANASYLVLTLFSLIGAPLAILVFLQTYLFEGQHTEEHLRSIRDELATNDCRYIPRKIRKILEKSIYIMGPLHGISCAVSTHVTLRELIDDPYLKWPLSSFTAFIIAIITAAGIHCSEVKEAQELLAVRYSN